MTLDNTSFVKKHEAPARVQSAGPDDMHRNVALLMIIVTLIISALFFAYIRFSSSMSVMAEGVALIALIASAMVAFFVYRMTRTFRKRERQYKAVWDSLDQSTSAHVITDAKGQAVFTNQAFVSLMKTTDLSGLKALEERISHHPESHRRFLALQEKIMQGTEDVIEVRAGRAEREQWLRILARPLLNGTQGTHWRVEDITQKSTIDRAIREEREKLIDFTDNAPVGFFSLDENGRFIFANATFARWVGEDLRTLLKQGHLHTYLVDPPEGANPYDLMTDGLARQVVEMRMKGTAGQTFQASINQVVVHEEDGKIRTRAVVHDLTSEREMRRALKASQDRFERFFAEAPVGIVQLDSKRIIVDCNRSFAEMLGSSEKNIEGASFTKYIGPENRQQVEMVLSRIKKEDSVSFPVEITLKAGDQPIVVKMYGGVLGDEGNIVLHFINVTETKVLEEQFVQSQKMQAIGQLAGGIAHDFNNLLTAITGFSDLLLLRHKPGDPSFSDIMQVKQNSNRAANLVRQLLAFSRQQTLRVKVQDITDILIELSHLLRRLIGAGIELDLVHGRDLGLVKVDEGQMEQVLINLAVNARDAMDSQGSLIIQTENIINEEPLELLTEELPPGEWVLITVTDTGCGIPKENLKRIFEPFFTTKDVGEGTGLGLATVYGIIRQTDGYLHVESQPGNGTSFKLYLPKTEEEEEIESPESAAQNEAPKDLTGSERILLVEDEDAVRMFSQRALGNKGYEVLTAESGEAALALMEDLEDKHLDLLITDVVMPGMDGPTLAQRFRQNSPELKVIFVSGYTEDKLKGSMGKHMHFLPKPFTLKVLAEKVKDVLEE